MSKFGVEVSLGRHQRTCSVCAHQEREEIESAFVAWRSPAAIAKEYGLADRSSDTTGDYRQLDLRRFRGRLRPHRDTPVLCPSRRPIQSTPFGTPLMDRPLLRVQIGA